MTKANAISLARRNTKIRHSSWMEGEWVIIRWNQVIDEHGKAWAVDHFFNVICASPQYNIGWRHYETL